MEQDGEQQPPAQPPRPHLPEDSKELLRGLAERLLLLHGQVEAADARAAVFEERVATLEAQVSALVQQLEAAGIKPDLPPLPRADEPGHRQDAGRDAGEPAPPLGWQQQLADAQRQLLDEAAKATAAQDDVARLQGQIAVLERRLAEAEEPAAAAIQREQQVGMRQCKAEAASLQAELAEERRLRQAAQQELAAARARQRDLEAQLERQAAEEEEGQQQQEQQQQQQQPRRPQQLAAEPAQGVAAQRPQAHAAPAAVDVDLAGSDGGGQGPSRSSAPGHSSEDDETIRDSAGAAAAVEPAVGRDGAPAAAAAAGAAPSPPEQQPCPAGGGGEPMGPPPKRVSGQAAGSAPGAGMPRKRQAEHAADGAAAVHAADGGVHSTTSAGSPSKRHRRASQAAEATPASPGGSAALAMAALRHGTQLTRRGSAGGTAAAAGGSPGRASAGNALLSLAAEQLAEVEGEEEEEREGGDRPRSGRRSRGGDHSSGGGAATVVLKPGETAVQWLNRSIAAYVSGLLRERDYQVFRRPVEEREAPGYHEVIAEPMDLGTIKSKAAQVRYATPNHFLSDLRLVVSNAQEYNVSPRHPVHQAATRLMEQLEKPYSFFCKVADQFREAEVAATLAEEKERQERELAALEQQLAASVRPGLNVAVYAADDRRNKYFLLQATRPLVTVDHRFTDDFGCEFRRGDRVVVGHYYDYWEDRPGKWDRSTRPYFLDTSKTAHVPADALLLVDFELRSRPQPERSLLDGREERVYEVSPELHGRLRREIKKMTAEPTVDLTKGDDSAAK